MEVPALEGVRMFFLESNILPGTAVDKSKNVVPLLFLILILQTSNWPRSRFDSSLKRAHTAFAGDERQLPKEINYK